MGQNKLILSRPFLNQLNKNSLTRMIFRDCSGPPQFDVQRASCETLLVLFDRLSVECRLDFLSSMFQDKFVCSQLRALGIDLLRGEIHQNFNAAPFSPEGELSIEMLTCGRRRKCLKNLVEGHILTKMNVQHEGNEEVLPFDSVVHASLSLVRYISISAVADTSRADGFRSFVDFRKVLSVYLTTLRQSCDKKMCAVQRILDQVKRDRDTLDEKTMEAGLKSSYLMDCDMRMTKYKAIENELRVTCVLYNQCKDLVSDIINNVRQRRSLNQ